MVNQFKGKKVLIFGLGINQGGLGATKFFAKAGAKIRVTDLKTKEELKASLDKLADFPDIEYIFGEHREEDFDWADLIIKNPAIKPKNKYLEYAKSRGKQIEMDMGIFLQFVKPSQIIGITGTKGKSTTSSLIYEVLKISHPWGVIFAGNIGRSVLDTLEHVTPETLVVLELSSFQLEAFDTHQVSPKWAVITNIYPDHLNYYKNMEEYILAKKVIAQYQTRDDFLFLKNIDKITNNPEFLKDLKGQINYFSKADLPAGRQGFRPNLPGEHNLENMAAALAVSQKFEIPQNQALQIMKNFKGVEFRLQLIKEVNGIKIYNDSAATNPDASIQAIKTLGVKLNHPPGDLILICGGMNKNMPYDEYAKTIDRYAKKVFFLSGDATDEIKRLMKNQEKIAGLYDDLQELLIDVKSVAAKGDTILFSPAATSLNLFQNEFDRGRKFNSAIEKIFR